MTITTTIKFDLHRPLLDQLDEVVGYETMQRAASFAHKVASDALGSAATTQEKLVSQHGLSAVTSVEPTSDGSVSRAILAACLLGATKKGQLTAHEKLEVAMAELSDRYQADW